MIHLLLKYRQIIFLFALLLTLMIFSVYIVNTNTIKSDNKFVAKINPQHKDLITWLGNHTVWQQQGTKRGWAGFDKVYFISLPQRLANVKQVAERLGVTDSAWILNAITKDSFDTNELLALNMLDKKYLAQLPREKYGCIGCQLSHLAVMLDCYKDPDAQTCVIFEDDLYKPTKIVTLQVVDFHKRIEKLGINWNILYLDYCFEKGGGKIVQDIRWLLGSSCTHAFVIKKNTFPIILNASVPMKISFDGTLIQLMQDQSFLAIGPNKARFFAQNRIRYNSTINPGFTDYPTLNLRRSH